MKEIKKVNSVHLDECGLNVKPYLTYAEIQTIANKAKTANDWAERQEIIDMCLLYFATDAGKAIIDNYTHDTWLASGIIDEVKAQIENMAQVDEALKYEESPMRIIMQIAKEMPEFNKKLDEVLKNGSSQK